MTAEQAIKRELCLMVMDSSEEFGEPPYPRKEVTEDNVDVIYEDIDSGEFSDLLCELRNEFRGSFTEETKIKCDYSRHYESKSVACKLKNGRWVGWTYWYGGGKHGEPDAIDWLEDAYFLDVKEEEKVVTVRTFTKA